MNSNKFTSSSAETVISSSGDTTVSSNGKTNIGGSTVSISGITYLGQDSLGGTSGENVVTVSGPSTKVKAKVT